MARRPDARNYPFQSVKLADGERGCDRNCPQKCAANLSSEDEDLYEPHMENELTAEDKPAEKEEP